MNIATFSDKYLLALLLDLFVFHYRKCLEYKRDYQNINGAELDGAQKVISLLLL